MFSPTLNKTLGDSKMNMWILVNQFAYYAVICSRLLLGSMFN